MWQEINNQLVRQFVFDNFIEAFAFLTKVALLSEKHNHHPHIVNVYNKVTLSLSTHDTGNSITPKDHKLAAAIDKLIWKLAN